MCEEIKGKIWAYPPVGNATRDRASPEPESIVSLWFWIKQIRDLFQDSTSLKQTSYTVDCILVPSSTEKVIMQTATGVKNAHF